jgi:hypothetical protein
MRRLRDRKVRSWLGVLATRAAPVCLAAALAAGCAATSPHEGATAAVTGSETRAAIPGEGLAARFPLLRGVRQQPVGAADPYSPLNGARAPYRMAHAAWPWSPAEEDAIIAEAITAHEMRRP